MSDITTTDMDTDIDYSTSTPNAFIYTGSGGDVMDILKTRPIRDNLSDLVYPGLLADNTKAQFVEISDIRATNMDVDFDLPCGASGAWGALELRYSEIPKGTIHWSFDDFNSELKTQVIIEVEYISGAGIPSYVVLGADDTEAGTLNRDKEDFRFYTDDGKLRIEELALPLQWNEINLLLKSGSGNSLELLLATII